jgi:hypothetical protein
MGLLVAILEIILGLKSGGIGFTVQFLSACFVGGSYSERQGSLITTSLKLRASIYYVLSSLAIAVIAIPLLNLQSFSGLIPSLILAVVLSFTFTYWGLSVGSKQYMKRVK